MRKIAIVLVMCVLLSAQAFAIDLGSVFKDAPEMKQGIGYSFLDNDIHYLMTVELAKYKSFTLEGGASFKRMEGDSTDVPNMPIVVLGYDIVKLKEKGVTFPVLRDIDANIGLYAGYGRVALGAGNAKGNNEFDWGLSITLINLKF